MNDWISQLDTFRFASPWWLLAVALIPVAMWLLGRAGSVSAVQFSSGALLHAAARKSRFSPGRYRPLLRHFALCFLILALARPQVDKGLADREALGINIMFVLDFSSTMKTKDFLLEGKRVSRVDAMKRMVSEFIKARESDRIGAVYFDAGAHLISPLTLDHEFLLENLNRLNLGSIEDGTAIGSALTAGLNRLRDLQAKSKIIILMTDGQNNAGKVPPLTAAEAAQALAVKVYTIGVGTRGEAPFPYTDAFGVRRYSMQPVDIDEDTLTKIADRTGGRYFRADNSEALRNIYSEIDRLEKTEAEVKKFQRYRELFPWLVLPGLTLLLLEIILSHTVWRKLP